MGVFGIIFLVIIFIAWIQDSSSKTIASKKGRFFAQQNNSESYIDGYGNQRLTSNNHKIEVIPVVMSDYAICHDKTTGESYKILKPEYKQLMNRQAKEEQRALENKQYAIEHGYYSYSKCIYFSPGKNPAFVDCRVEDDLMMYTFRGDYHDANYGFFVAKTNNDNVETKREILKYNQRRLEELKRYGSYVPAIITSEDGHKGVRFDYDQAVMYCKKYKIIITEEDIQDEQKQEKPNKRNRRTNTND